MHFKLSKVKGGKVNLYNELNKIKKINGKGTPALKKLDESELNEIEADRGELNETRGRGKRPVAKSIKPLQFKY